MSRSSLFAALVLIGAGVAPLQAAPLLYMSKDTRAGGTATVVDSPTNDGNGSFRLTTDSSIAGGSQAKADFVFFRAGNQPLGTLGSLTSFSFDYLVDPNSTTNSGSGQTTSAPAIRLLLNPALDPAGLGLVWEQVYQTPSSTTPGEWQNDVDLASQLFWQRANGTNYDTGTNFKTLADWAAGYNPGSGVTFNTNTEIFGIQVSFGSGITGQFTGYVDDVRISFNDGTVFTADAAVPEPVSIATFSGLMFAGAVGYVRRKRAKSA